MVPLFKHWRTSFERVDKFLSDKYFTDVNLYGKLIRETRCLSSISHFNIVTQPTLSVISGGSNVKDEDALSWDQVSSSSDWSDVDMNSFTFGPTWSVHWFKVSFTIPLSWASRDLSEAQLHWMSGCEILVFSSDGDILLGLNSTHGRISVPLSLVTKSSEDGQTYVLYLQASCSDLFGAGENGMINPPSRDKVFRVEVARLVLVHTLATLLYRDLKLTLEIAEALKDSERGHKAMYSCNETVNIMVDLTDDDLDKKIIRARKTLDQFFSVENGGSQVSLHAMGHCHIDSAWLWRYGETRRKTARSWSNALRLMEEHSNMTFVCSQAQQLAWLEQDYPDLFHSLQKMAIRHQFVPAGGVWVEMDVNVPCCESLCRQFLYGQRFFRRMFGSYCKEFWLPDTFGYSPQLPQIMRLANISRFMTQKLSWSLVNKFPHHTFWWCGIDGSKVLTHFPPGDSYSMNGKVSEMLHSANNFSDKGRSSSMMYLYGYGDGGQGPTNEMLHVLNRLGNCDGIPKIIHSTPDIFFSAVERSDSKNLCTWVGELYLELHNGTYTSQRQIKKANVSCEQLLRSLEFLVCVCEPSSLDHGDHIRDIVLPIMDQLESKWKLLLLNQFHDVLPGSSIEDVNDDAYWILTSLVEWCHNSIRKLSSALTQSSFFCLNPTSWALIVPVQSAETGVPLGFSSIAPYTVTGVKVSDLTFEKVGYEFVKEKMEHHIWNQFIDVSVDEQCRITSLKMTSSEIGDVLDGFANDLLLYDDVPLYWDAWDVMDYHLETGVPLSSVASFKVKHPGDLSSRDQAHVTLTCTLMVQNTGTMVQKSVSVFAHLDRVHLETKVLVWNETHKFLKVGIQTGVMAVTEAQYRIQGGFISRPCHRNTSWDSAKFELCSHEWVHVGETNWGVAVFKSAMFGSSVSGGTIFLSLLRSPTCPDATADKKHGPHLFEYAIYPYQGSEGHRFAHISSRAAQFLWMTSWPGSCFVTKPEGPDLPSREVSFPLRLQSPISGQVTIDWIKPSCDNPGKMVVVRIHEQVGGRFLVKMSSASIIHHVCLVNILEESLEGDDCGGDLQFSQTNIQFYITPFQIMSLAVHFLLPRDGS